MGTLDVDIIFQVIHVCLAVLTFGVYASGRAPKRLRAMGAIGALWVGFSLIGFGAMIQFITGGDNWAGLDSYLTLRRGTIGHGTTFLAIGYGTLAYSIFQALILIWKGKIDG